MTLTHAEFSRKGGQSKSARKIAAVRKNALKGAKMASLLAKIKPGATALVKDDLEGPRWTLTGKIWRDNDGTRYASIKTNSGGEFEINIFALRNIRPPLDGTAK